MDLDNEELEATVNKNKNSNLIENYKNLIADISMIAKELGLEEDATIDEVIIQIRYYKLLNDELKDRLKSLKSENERIRIARVENLYGYENYYFITEDRLITIDTNKYFIEIKPNKFIDLKQVYLDNKNSIPKQVVIDKIEDLEKKMKYEQNEKALIHLHKQIKILKELLEDK